MVLLLGEKKCRAGRLCGILTWTLREKVWDGGCAILLKEKTQPEALGTPQWSSNDTLEVTLVALAPSWSGPKLWLELLAGWGTGGNSQLVTFLWSYTVFQNTKENLKLLMWLRIIILPEELTLLVARVEHYTYNVCNMYTYMLHIIFMFSRMRTSTLRDILTVLVSLRIGYIA